MSNGGSKGTTQRERRNHARTVCFRGRTLESVANSQVVSLTVLLTFRLASLVVLVLGGALIRSRTWEQPLCLPDWSYIASTLYLVMAFVASLKYAHRVRSLSPEGAEEATGSKLAVASSFTLFFFEISVVFQTIAVIVTSLEYAHDPEKMQLAVLSFFGMGAVLVDFLLNQCTVEVRHAGILISFLLAWMLEQVIWVSTGSNHQACYDVFGAKGLVSVASAILMSFVVIALAFAYAAMCAQRDKLMLRLGLSPAEDPTMQGDVEEDLGEDAVVRRAVRVPPPPMVAAPTVGASSASERASVVNPIFAGSGSRMKVNSSSDCGASLVSLPSGVRGWGGDRRSSLGSIETDLSSGELDKMDTQGTTTSKGSRGRQMSGSSSVGALSRESSRTDRRSERNNGVIPQHSAWAGYGGGGAAAWVRSVRDESPPARGVVVKGGGGHRRSNSRY